MQLFNDDCLKVLPTLPDNSIDLVLTDPPYGTTPCKWDSVIPLDKMWHALKRIIKKESAILLFGTEPFSSYLRTSNVNWFKYDWIWEKQNGANFLVANYQPLKVHEIISVFGNAPTSYSKNKPMLYNPQETIGVPYKQKSGKQKTEKENSTVRSKIDQVITENNGTRKPRTIIKFNIDKDKIHPTQKPIALLEYLIKTYTNEGDTVLDFTMGSGSTGVACKNLNRNFIGIEMDKNYFDIAKNRIETTLI
jgi:site-specific DNA-methyltransferase (adenine-specific)